MGNLLIHVAIFVSNIQKCEVLYKSTFPVTFKIWALQQQQYSPLFIFVLFRHKASDLATLRLHAAWHTVNIHPDNEQGSSHVRQWQFWSQLVREKVKVRASVGGNVSPCAAPPENPAHYLPVRDSSPLTLLSEQHPFPDTAGVESIAPKHTHTHTCVSPHTLSVHLHSPSNNSIKHESQVRKLEQIFPFWGAQAAALQFFVLQIKGRGGKFGLAELRSGVL